MPRTLLACLLLLPALAGAAEDVIPPDEAFRYTVTATADELRVDWRIEPGYYLYRHRFGFDSRTDSVEL
ncbi:MAG: protein-disulfide reductase DsbD N-terminal domain-containing protein, partial [Gammaproteobacteria bacterium]|nr:protein-disulfide reductase DsbD N-terminal domain-containing protein [Gammaproteobacteria bacterium]NNM20197.1 hypothetical protein [Gammaproteobacteria bacterium]